ncbi:hypothetical protein HOLleu_07803 [Holothuria leucospilota]|uniref:Uncharacterized protein n=1 Tax=Holothuria leucospilota TaxID=206669 RepID=A0A9Q1CI46_HOLLE|nr:hypothetical protein HOLleu_07803 [Holothuria leucospilota]
MQLVQEVPTLRELGFSFCAQLAVNAPDTVHIKYADPGRPKNGTYSDKEPRKEGNQFRRRKRVLSSLN